MWTPSHIYAVVTIHHDDDDEYEWRWTFAVGLQTPLIMLKMWKILLVKKSLRMNKKCVCKAEGRCEIMEKGRSDAEREIIGKCLLSTSQIAIEVNHFSLWCIKPSQIWRYNCDSECTLMENIFLPLSLRKKKRSSAA